MFNPVNQTVQSIARMTGMVLMAATMVACGYKGPLYLPPPPDTLGGKDSSISTGSLPESEQRRGEPMAIQEESLLSPPPVLTQ